MTQSPNSPQAQEVKLLPCPKCQSPIISTVYDLPDMTGWRVKCHSCGIQTELNFDEFLAITSWNTRAPNENQPPLAEKAPTTPQLSGQSEGNREKEALDALEWLAKEENHIQRCSGKYVIRGVFYNGEVSFGEGSTPLLAIQNAMNSQGGKP